MCLCDVTGTMAEPWVEAGYTAVLVDPQHPEGVTRKGHVIKVGHVLGHPETWRTLRKVMSRTVFVAGFPVCTDLAVSGTSRWAAKREANPHFQAHAMTLVHECRIVGEISGAPWFFENPVSAISSLSTASLITRSTRTSMGATCRKACPTPTTPSISRHKMRTRRRPACGPAVALSCQRNALCLWSRRRVRGEVTHTTGWVGGPRKPKISAVPHHAVLPVRCLKPTRPI